MADFDSFLWISFEEEKRVFMLIQEGLGKLRNIRGVIGTGG